MKNTITQPVCQEPTCEHYGTPDGGIHRTEFVNDGPRRHSRTVRWHRVQDVQYPEWSAERDGIEIARAAMTGRAGVDNYPWDWWLIRGESGVSDTLRSAKARVAERVGR